MHDVFVALIGLLGIGIPAVSTIVVQRIIARNQSKLDAARIAMEQSQQAHTQQIGDTNARHLELREIVEELRIEVDRATERADRATARADACEQRENALRTRISALERATG